MSYTPFNPKSKRAIAGLGFQREILENLQMTFPKVGFEMTWDFFKSKNPDYTDKQLAILEKENGDITYVFNGNRHFIECCFAMGTEVSRLCEMKRQKFVGENKWYCYGFAGTKEIILIPSFVWRKYTETIKPSDRSCRMVPIKAIKGIRAGCKSLESYWSTVHD